VSPLQTNKKYTLRSGNFKPMDKLFIITVIIIKQTLTKVKHMKKVIHMPCVYCINE